MSKHNAVRLTKNDGVAVRFLKNPLAVASAVFLLVITLMCICAPLFTDYKYTEIALEERHAGISPEHILGTDFLGRDLFCRLLYGGRNTLGIAAQALILSALTGTAIGVGAGVCGGTVDEIVMRVMDAVSAVPTVLLTVAMECALGWGGGNYKYAVAIAFVPQFVRVVRVSTISIMTSEYIEAARALGLGKLKIIKDHVLHNVMSPLIIQITSSAAEIFLLGTIINYIGFGIRPPLPEWGDMVATGYNDLRIYPLVSGVPCAAIFLCAMALNLVGNGLRDAMVPGGTTVHYSWRGRK